MGKKVFGHIKFLLNPNYCSEIFATVFLSVFQKVWLHRSCAIFFNVFIVDCCLLFTRLNNTYYSCRNSQFWAGWNCARAARGTFFPSTVCDYVKDMMWNTQNQVVRMRFTIIPLWRDKKHCSLFFVKAKQKMQKRKCGEKCYSCASDMCLHLDVVFRFMLPHFETKVQDFCTPPSPQRQLVKNFHSISGKPCEGLLTEAFLYKKNNLNLTRHFHSPCRELRCAFPTRDIPSFHTSAGSLNARRAKGNVSHRLPLICFTAA